MSGISSCILGIAVLLIAITGIGAQSFVSITSLAIQPSTIVALENIATSGDEASTDDSNIKRSPLQIRCVYPDGRPAIGAEVCFICGIQGLRIYKYCRCEFSDELGNIIINDLRYNDFIVRAESNDGNFRSGLVKLDYNENTADEAVKIELRPMITVRGRVLGDQSLRPIEARITCNNDYAAMSDKDGRFELRTIDTFEWGEFFITDNQKYIGRNEFDPAGETIIYMPRE